jgi:hypothetical protein
LISKESWLLKSVAKVDAVLEVVDEEGTGGDEVELVLEVELEGEVMAAREVPEVEVEPEVEELEAIMVSEVDEDEDEEVDLTSEAWRIR